MKGGRDCSLPPISFVFFLFGKDIARLGKGLVHPLTDQDIIVSPRLPAIYAELFCYLSHCDPSHDFTRNSHTLARAHDNARFPRWSWWRDLNSRKQPHPYQGCALPAELHQHVVGQDQYIMTNKQRKGNVCLYLCATPNTARPKHSIK